MLTGELPAKTIEPPSRKVQIDVRLDEVVLRALEQNPETRYQRASVLKLDWRRLWRRHPIPLPLNLPATFLTHMNTNTRRSIWIWTVGAVVVVGLLALEFVVFHKSVKPNPAQPRNPEGSATSNNPKVTGTPLSPPIPKPSPQSP